jgi:alcohol dehydrogenase (cytochrome c)
MRAHWLALVIGCALLGSSLLAQVSPDRILNAQKEPQNWLTYSGTYMSQRYSQLTQVTPANVKSLELKWVFQARWLDYNQATPLVVDGVLYTTQGNDVLALDATTGKIFWIFPYTPSSDARFCCGRITRGLAVHGDTLFLATIDAHLIAIDAKSGRALWNTVVANGAAGYSMSAAPLVIKDKVIVGTAGGEFGIRGFLAAYDIATGKQAWRFNTVPLPGEPGHDTWGQGWVHGGASIWVTGSYDPETNLTFWGVGNPGPDYNAESRPGDNLYSCSVVALDADTGKLKWHYQFMPNDEFDWDAVQIPVLADISWKGSPRKTMLWANRNGFFYVLDRTNGKMILAKPFVTQNWAKEISPEGRPILNTGINPSEEGSVKVCPDLGGGTNFFSPSYDPTQQLFFVNSRETCAIYFSWHEPFRQGEQYESGGTTRPPDQKNFGALRAIDPLTGERKWEFRYPVTSSSGVLSTAAGLVFSGDGDGNIIALDSKSGKYLWHYQLGVGLRSTGGTTYMVDGKQYLLVPSGSALTAFALP